MFVCVHLFILLLTLTLFVQDGATALHVACFNNHDNVVSILVAAKANIDLQDNVSLVLVITYVCNCTCFMYAPVDRQCI